MLPVSSLLVLRENQVMSGLCSFMYQNFTEHHQTVKHIPSSQNTITNARRLLKDAEELTESGQCDVEEITNIARQLEARVGTFIFRVERRRQLLELSVSFHTNAKEVRD